MKPVDTKTSLLATTQIAELMRDVEVLMQTPETVEIGQLARLINRLNGEFSLMQSQAGALAMADRAATAALDFTFLDGEIDGENDGADEALDAQQIESLAERL